MLISFFIAYICIQMYSQLANSTILITGCSRGLGFQLVKIICTRNPTCNIIGTVRSQQQQLQNLFNQQFPQNKLTLQKLDITCSSSVHAFAEKLKQKNVKLDILVNNSGVYLDEMRAGDIFFGSWADNQKMTNSNHLSEDLQKTFATNFYGTVNLTENLLPLLQQNGRIITVSSGMGGLKYHSEEVQQKFRNPQITMQEISEEIKNFIQDAPHKKFNGYMPNAYATSKMMLNAWNRYILPKRLKGSQICIGMSPGFCKTDMGGQKAYRSAVDGAQSIYSYFEGKYSHQLFYHELDPCSYDLCHQ